MIRHRTSACLKSSIVSARTILQEISATGPGCYGNTDMDKTIRDNIHGDIPVSSVQREILDTPAMQRLRGIKQLGTSNLVYPCAVHSRFQHSLGTCFMAKRILAALRDNCGFEIDRREEEAIALAALLHDITHIPFGHTLEDERRIFPRHDMDDQRLEYFVGAGEIAAILRREKLLNRVKSLLSAHDDTPENPPYASQIISHAICADLLDYLRRDAVNCGLKLDFDDRIFRYFMIESDRLILNLQKDGLFRHDAFSEVIHLLRIRYFLTERVYYHHAKIAAGAMLSRAVEQAAAKGFDSERLYGLTDDALLYVLQTEYQGDRTIARLMRRFLGRTFYKRCFVLTEHNLSPESRRELSDKYHLNLKDERTKAERHIAKVARIPHESVIVYAPPPSMNLKEADVLVKVDHSGARPLVNWKNREVASLQEKFGKLWKFYVFIDPDYQQRFKTISDACESYFGRENELHLIQIGQLSLFPAAGTMFDA